MSKCKWPLVKFVYIQIIRNSNFIVPYPNSDVLEGKTIIGSQPSFESDLKA